MHVVTQKRIWAPKATWPRSATALDTWYRLIKAATPIDFASLKQTFPAIDKVGELHVFDIGGNKLRLIAVVNDRSLSENLHSTHPLACRVRHRTMEDDVNVTSKTYDERVRPMPAVSGADALRYLMQEHSLTRDDLAVLGTGSVISDILAGKRDISVPEARALARRFGLPATVFLSL